jgi:hypothetical protein
LNPISLLLKYLGVVTSSKWFSCYVVILDGVLTLYADEQSSLENPQDAVLKINLSKYHTVSGDGKIENIPYTVFILNFKYVLKSKASLLKTEISVPIV